MITPDDIVGKAANAYKRYLDLWARGEAADFFPLRVPANLRVDAKDVAATIRAVSRLRDKSKERRGWGYTVHWKRVAFRELGSNLTPERITIDTREDLLRLADKQEDFAAACEVAGRLQTAFPGLADWIITNVRSLAGYAAAMEGLIAVTRHFLDHPWPDCYARQFPVNVDTKFIERHQAVLRQWLDVLLPPSAIDVNETKFAPRFGLRDGRRHRAIRLLDDALLGELTLPVDELSLPLPALATLPVRGATVVIVENRLNLFTLPRLPRGLGMEGEGKAVTRLEKLPWLHDNRLLYWGDIDVEGFEILSSLRNLFPHVESVMMDVATLNLHEDCLVEGNGRKGAVKSNLTEGELAAYRLCQQRNLRLEQERILQRHADATLHDAWSQPMPNAPGSAT
ncbi:MAG: DUF2220 family protein [Patescibacteria group bacterium]|nr:DUF2220 family protein [Patescibacteria group bacterium]